MPLACAGIAEAACSEVYLEYRCHIKDFHVSHVFAAGSNEIERDDASLRAAILVIGIGVQPYNRPTVTVV